MSRSGGSPDEKDLLGSVERGWRRATGGNALEVGVLAATALALLTAAVFTVRAAFAEAYREDLVFRGALEKTDSLIQNQGPMGVATYRRASLRVGGRDVPVDSLAVSGDSILFPSLAKGGFLRDHVEAFNDYATRQAARALASRRALSPATSSPSLFHLARTDSGQYYLSSDLNDLALMVPSPFRERQWTAVRTSDWSTGPMLLGLVGSAPLGTTDSTLSTPYRLNGGSGCRVKEDGARSSLLYCRSAAGSDVGQAFDLAFDLRTEASFASGAGVRLSRQSSLWTNGARGEVPGTVNAGDVLFAEPVGPLVFSDVQTGVLAGPQWVNGRVGLALARGGTLEYFARAGRSMPTGTPDPVTLGFDAAFANSLDARVDDFVGRNGDYLESVSIVIADLATGEVRAISESSRGDGRPLRAFEPVLLGSMVKPILAAALLSRDSSLAGTRVSWAGPEVSQVAGIALRVPFKNPLNGCPQEIDFDAFLRCSSNQYAAELLVRSIQRSAGRADIASSDGVVAKSLLEHTALTDGILSLYEDVDVVARRSPERSDRPWRSPADSVTQAAGTAVRVPSDATLRPWKSRAWFTYYADDPRETAVDWLARFAFGGWENRWTLLGAAEAYARIATGRRVQLGFVNQPAGATAFAPFDPQASEALRRVRHALLQVGEEGTARGLTPILGNIAPRDSLVVLAKTGTLNEITSRAQDDDVYLKSLAMVVGKPSAKGADAPLGCGLVAITYFEFRQDWRLRVGAGDASSLPDLHKEFATAELTPAMREAWTRMGVCR
jgi:hypothetical protein